MIILLLCIIAFVLIFGSRALLDIGFWILAVAFFLAIAALVIVSAVGILGYAYENHWFLLSGLALAGIGVVSYLTGEMK